MEVLIGKYSGFCAGVKHTIETAKKILKENKTVYCLGEIVHNEDVVKELEKLGMIRVDNIDEIPNNSKVIFRAHGEPLNVYEAAQRKHLEIYDLTCGKIRIIHNNIEKNNDSFIIVIAKKNHPETLSTISHANDYYIVSDINDIIDCYNKYLKLNKNNIYIVSQTTFSNELFDVLVDKIKEVFKNENITINKSICNATNNRQDEVIRLSKEVDIMIIVGGKNSSNTKELYNLSKVYCQETYLIQNSSDLNIKINKNKTIGLMAGASTPDTTIKEIVNKIIKK